MGVNSLCPMQVLGVKQSLAVERQREIISESFLFSKHFFPAHVSILTSEEVSSGNDVVVFVQLGRLFLDPFGMV